MYSVQRRMQKFKNSGQFFGLIPPFKTLFLRCRYIFITNEYTYVYWHLSHAYSVCEEGFTYTNVRGHSVEQLKRSTKSGLKSRRQQLKKLCLFWRIRKMCNDFIVLVFVLTNNWKVVCFSWSCPFYVKTRLFSHETQTTVQ